MTWLSFFIRLDLSVLILFGILGFSPTPNPDSFDLKMDRSCRIIAGFAFTILLLLLVWS